MTRQHTVKSFDQELSLLRHNIFTMGQITTGMLAQSVESNMRRDTAMAQEVIAKDNQVDDLESKINIDAVRLLALRQPMANDLRHVVTAIKVSSDIERIADYATSIARRTRRLVEVPFLPPEKRIDRMNKLVMSMLGEVLDRYDQEQFAASLPIWDQDREVDDMYTSLFRELVTYMIEDPRQISACTHLLFIAKNLERVGDHVTNIVESMYYLMHGGPMPDKSRDSDDADAEESLRRYSKVNPAWVKKS